MKAFTDIEQSKKLAEILPIESADGFYEAQHNHLTDKWEYILFTDNKWASEEVVIPCWSLAALLDYLAKKDCFPEVTYTGTCYLMDVNFYDDEEGKLLHPIHFIRTEGKSLVDAAVEMIIKLHEEKLL